jgi:DNA-binding IclR family transcriptional regulator
MAFGGHPEQDALTDQLATVRRTGYAVAIDELELGLAGIAAPVVAAGGQAFAALSISGPTLRLTAERIADLHPKLIDEAQALGHDMGATAA